MSLDTHETQPGIDERLDEIERALKFDPDPEYRRQLIREYLALSEPTKDEAA